MLLLHLKVKLQLPLLLSNMIPQAVAAAVAPATATTARDHPRQHVHQTPRPSIPTEIDKSEARHRQQGTHKWHSCLLSFRPATDGKKAAWQATCPRHSSTSRSAACTRTRTFKTTDHEPTSAESERILRLLKSWLLRASECDTKEAHQQVPDQAMDSAEFNRRAADLANSSSSTDTEVGEAPGPSTKRSRTR